MNQWISWKNGFFNFSLMYILRIRIHLRSLLRLNSKDLTSHHQEASLTTTPTPGQTTVSRNGFRFRWQFRDLCRRVGLVSFKAVSNSVGSPVWLHNSRVPTRLEAGSELRKLSQCPFRKHLKQRLLVRAFEKPTVRRTDQELQGGNCQLQLQFRLLRVKTAGSMTSRNPATYLHELAT